MDRSLEVVEEEQFSYKIDTFGGQSGGAVWIRKWGDPRVVGVHTNGGITSNFGVRLSRDKLETIVRKWVEETGKITDTSAVSAVSVSPTYPPVLSGGGSGTGDPSGSVEWPLGPAIPDIAKGYEEIYLRFIRGSLIYKPNKDSDVGRIDLPFAALPNPLEGEPLIYRGAEMRISI